MPRLKLGAAVYALIAILMGVGTVLTLQQVGSYAEVDGWPSKATAAVLALTAVLFAVGAVTRRGLIADDGPWICRSGWLVVAGLTVVAFVISFWIDEGGSPFPLGPALLVPHWIRRTQEQYYLGVADGEREVAVLRAAERAGEIPPRPRTSRWFGR